VSREQFYVITGASGAGKSSLLNALGQRGYSVVPEAALSIVQEQETSGGALLPGTNLQAFMNEVVERNIRSYDAARSLPAPVFFDRGILECIGHMLLLNLDIDSAYIHASKARRYANPIFVAEPWPEIYVHDQLAACAFCACSAFVWADHNTVCSGRVHNLRASEGVDRTAGRVHS
jgi:predicted ATPase